MKKVSHALLFLFFFLSLSKNSLLAQPPASWTSSDMYLALRKLNVLGSVLYLAAHPDDENTRLLSYFSKDRMYRTGYLSLTRGDGGQNLIGNEQGVELGLIRTQELLAARRIDGAEQFFTRAYDFGFSKNPEETFTKWDREKILSDVVWVIRKFQPDIIITRFPTTGEGGHGHHTASAILANEAFTAAADPKRFPEQLKFVNPWQAKRILWNTFNFGGTNTTSADQFKLDVGGYNPLLGKSYGEIAAISRSNHKSQGFGASASRGEAIEYFKTTGGSTPTNDLMDDVDLTWKRVKGGEKIAGIIDKLSSSFDLLHPERSVKDLVVLYQTITTLPDGYWKNQKLKETQQLIEQCSGLFLDATTTEQFAVQTDSIRINFFANNRLGVNAVLKNISVDAFDSTFNISLPKNKNQFFGKTFFVPTRKPITQPYWLENKMEEGYFNVKDQQKIGQADVDPAYITNFTLNIEGQDFNFAKPVKYKFTDPVKGELYQPLVIVPRVLIDIDPTNVIKTAKESSLFSVSIKAVKNFKSNDASLLIDEDITPDYLKQHLPSIEKDRIITDEFKISDTITYSPRHIYLMNGNENEIYTNSLKTIRYDHVPYITYYKTSEINYSVFDLKTMGKKIGYIIGAGDKVPEALEQMGYEVTLLTDKELSRNNLAQFDAILTGVRAYNTNEWMNKYYDKLMKYINDGGNLIVQYNTSTNIGPVRARISPYNFDISRTRITNENAEVKFLNPDLTVLNFPNKITQDDFKGWIQERSIYHASNFDKNNFEAVFSMHDPGENDDDGSLIIARYGKGTFVYTGLVFFRELPAGVPGAYRIMANLIALNKQKAF
ncbi:MAG TPA: PIG-L family deacetylase [Chitinophagaceae bacterium]|jgi:LmbE family N-acetylglucosaminyl deacetylase|nr:PIG-L family deacetylase [Chitinophagaceae bacterium]